MAADDPATQGARTSTAMVLALLNWLGPYTLRVKEWSVKEMHTSSKPIMKIVVVNDSMLLWNRKVSP